MASKSLTREQRQIQSQASSKTRKNEQAKAETARMIVGGSALLTSALAGVIDKRSLDKDGKRAAFKIFGVNVPVNAAAGIAGFAGGLALGKGEVAAGMLGAGIGAGSCAVYGMVLDRESEPED